MDIQLYEVQEQELISSWMDSIRQIDPHQYERCRGMERDLASLLKVFTHYPSILDQQVLGDEVYSLDSLIGILFRDGCDHTVLLPTKIVVGRSFVVAKFNFIGYLLKISDRHRELSRHKEDLQKTWECAIFSLLIEDVYQVIIEREEGIYPSKLRRQAAVDLIHLWEYRFDRNVSNYAPIIVDLWRVRKSIAPVFGTMLGTMELMKLSSLLSDRWHTFLYQQGDDREVIQALEEFIFGLTYEQITTVRSAMQHQSISVIGREELPSMLKKEAVHQEVSSVDPRAMYRFYQHRSKQLTRRSLADLPGPRRSLEEMLLAFLITQRLES